MPVARAPKKNKRRNPQTESAILGGALTVFAAKGFDSATISAICKEAQVSDATLYEYFASKEDVLFAISEVYTRRELERMTAIAHYVHTPRERMRLVIQGYLEFYENNPLYTSVALLTLKGNRRFVASASYEPIRASARTIVQAFTQGVEAGVFRSELDAYLVRNMVLGFIEHLTTQWLLLGRPEHIADCRDTIFDMVMRAIEVAPEPDALVVHVRGAAATQLVSCLAEES